MTNVRAIKPNELPEVAGLGERFFAEANLPGRFDPAVWVRTWASLLETKVGRMLALANDSGHITGAFGWVVFPDPNDAAMVGQECFWWVAPESRGKGFALLAEAEKEARGAGCSRLVVAHLAALNERLGPIYARRGYRPLETSYMLELWPSQPAQQ